MYMNSILCSHMIPILLATSRASKSLVNLTYAFLLPLGVIKVLTFLILILYNLSTASLIWVLFVFFFTMNTSVLLSSMVLMADSVLRGWSTTAKPSVCFFTALRMFFGDLFWANVFGLLKEVLVQILLLRAWWDPFLTAVAAFFATAYH